LLFEGFIGGFIKEVLKGQARVKFQASDMTLVDDVEYAGQSLGKIFTMRHDVLVEHKEKGLFILDTKYKEISRFEDNQDLRQSINSEISQNDFYQMISYAVKRGISDVYLLYPLYRLEENEPDFPIALSNLASGNSIHVHLVRLPFVFEEDIEKTKQMLAAAINKIFE
jgi:5-methylcytosine-specific restriction endonuclease McrBC regulatory subunit McrC